MVQGLLAGARDMLMKYVARMTATLETSCKKQSMPGHKCNSRVEISWCGLAKAFEPLSAP